VFYWPIYGGAIGAENFPPKAVTQVWEDREAHVAEGETAPTCINVAGLSRERQRTRSLGRDDAWGTAAAPPGRSRP